MKPKKILTTILAMIMVCALLASCGGGAANKALQDWVDDHGQKVAQGNSAYESATAAAGPNNDAAGMLAAADAFLPILNAALNALNRLDYNGLSSDNKDTYDGEKQGLESLISDVTENRGIWESFAQQQGGGADDYGDDDYGYDDDYGHDDDYGYDDDYGDDYGGDYDAYVEDYQQNINAFIEDFGRLMIGLNELLVNSDYISDFDELQTWCRNFVQIHELIGDTAGALANVAHQVPDQFQESHAKLTVAVAAVYDAMSAFEYSVDAAFNGDDEALFAGLETFVGNIDAAGDLWQEAVTYN